MAAGARDVRVPNFWPNVACPEVDHGIAIARGDPARAGARVLVHGSFAVTAEEAAACRVHLMKAVTLQLRNPNLDLATLGEDQLLFDDDISRDGDLLRGCFTIDLLETFELTPEPAKYWLTASILGHVSDVLTIEVS